MTTDEIARQIARQVECSMQIRPATDPRIGNFVVFSKNGQTYGTFIEPDTDVTAKALEVRNALHKAGQPQMKPPERKNE